MRKNEQTIKLIEQLKAAVEQTDAHCVETRGMVIDLADRVRGRERAKATLTPPVLPGWGDRVLTDNERGAVENLLYFKADQTGLSVRDIELALERFFNIEDEGIRAIRGWEFDSAMRYLVDFEPEAAAGGKP